MQQSKLRRALRAAFPVMFGYLFLGIPCGILCISAGLTPLQVILLAVFLYSGTGQFILPNMMFAGAAISATVASIVLVSLRHLLYSVGLVKYFRGEKNIWKFLGSFNITDESFGVNIGMFQTNKDWEAKDTYTVNAFCHLSWIIACVIGVFAANVLVIPSEIASFAMTAIFISLLFAQKITSSNVVCAIFAGLGVLIAKILGLDSVAVLIGAVIGIIAGAIFYKIAKNNPKLQLSKGGRR